MTRDLPPSPRRARRARRGALPLLALSLAPLLLSLPVALRPGLGPGSGAALAAGNGAIAFSDGGSGGRDLFVVQPDGTGRQGLVSVPAGREAQPTWSPDGRYVAFTTELPDGLWAIARVELATGDVRLLTNGPGDLEPEWSRDGRLIAFSAFLPSATQVERSTIAVMAADGSGQRPVVELVNAGAVITSPTWSPDGRRLAFVLRGNSQGGELYVVNLDGTGARRLVAHPGWDDLDPVWSPDGLRIAFAAGPHRPGQTAEQVQHGIWMADLESGALGSVYADPALDLRRPSWSPDGSQLAMDGRRPGGGVFELYVAPAAGGLLVGPLTSGAEPSWGSRLGPVPTPGTPLASATLPPTVEFPTQTPPPVPSVPSEPTLPPFPTIGPPEASPTGPPPTFAWPSPTPTATDTASPTASPTASATASASPTAPPVRPQLYLPWLESPTLPEHRALHRAAAGRP
jgi:Tol biopolymer transport system component